MSRTTTDGFAEAEFDHFAASYDQLLMDPLRVGFASDSLHFCRRKWWVIDRLLRRFGRYTESMSWLDVGCGRGELLDLAGNYFANAAGCDPSAEMLSTGRSFVMHKQPRPDELPFPSHSFDLITTVCVYHHVPVEERPVLTCEIRRVLRPGGLLCIVEHNPFNPVTRTIVNRCPVDVDAELLSLRSASVLVKASQFQLAASEYFLYLPERWFQRLSWIESVLRRVPLGGQYVLLARRDD